MCLDFRELEVMERAEAVVRGDFRGGYEASGMPGNRNFTEVASPELAHEAHNLKNTELEGLSSGP
jgi:hypothetical protein